MDVLGARYGEAMTILILLAGLAAAVAAVVGYVAWRESRSRGSFLHPSISRDALAQVHRQAVRGRLAEADMPIIRVAHHSPGSHSQARRF